MEVLLSGTQTLDKCPVSEPYYSSCWLPIENRTIWKLDYIKTVPLNRNKLILVALKLIRKYFNPEEMKQLITSNIYTVLYYNCEIWLILSLNQALHRHLKAASSAVLGLCGKRDWTTSQEVMHRTHKRATPEGMMNYNYKSSQDGNGLVKGFRNESK